jgi:hypothetical protein
MGKLSELVDRDYDEEVKIIRETGGNLWVQGLVMGFVLAVMWGFDLFLNKPWTKNEICYGILFVIAFPFADRVWERYKVAAQMRHHRAVRVELKLDALLGLINIKDVEEDE